MVMFGKASFCSLIAMMFKPFFAGSFSFESNFFASLPNSVMTSFSGDSKNWTLEISMSLSFCSRGVGDLPVVDDKGNDAKMNAMRKNLMNEISANFTHPSSEKMLLGENLATLYSNLEFDFLKSSKEGSKNSSYASLKNGISPHWKCPGVWGKRFRQSISTPKVRVFS